MDDCLDGLWNCGVLLSKHTGEYFFLDGDAEGIWYLT